MFSSSISQSRALVAVIVAVTVLLMSAVPPSSSAKPVPSNTYTAHVVNHGANKVILVRCNSNQGSQVEESVNVDLELAWSFKADENTSWRCYVATTNKHKDFVIFGPGRDWTPVLDRQHNFYWLAESNGIFLKNPVSGSESLAYRWDQGGVAELA